MDVKINSPGKHQKVEIWLVKAQVWIAISGYVLLAIVKKRLHLGQSLYTILQILAINVFEKERLFQVLTRHEHSNLQPKPDNRLNLFT